MIDILNETLKGSFMNNLMPINLAVHKKLFSFLEETNCGY